MIVRPLDSTALRNARQRPFAFIIDAHKSSGVYAVREGDQNVRHIHVDDLRAFDGIVYMLCRPSRLLAATDARQWTGYSWNGGINKLVLDGGPSFYPFTTAIKGQGYSAAESIDACFELFDWLRKRAVVPGSLSSMTWRLWRTTLDRPLRLASRRILGTKSLYGGRQEAPYPGSYVGCSYFDITAAYPTSMALAPYPTEFRDAGKHVGEGVGFARATVVIPQMEWPPLPVRLSRHALVYGHGTATGFWPWSDLRLAKDVGCNVEIHESWQGANHEDLFGLWWEHVVQDGRGKIALSKAVTSRLWGAFTLSQSTGHLIRWSDAEGRYPIRAQLQADRQRPIPSAPYIAAETTARVRNRLYREGVLDTSDVIYVDTDAIISGGSRTPDNFGLSPGQWRLKANMVRCEIRGPQLFRHECPTCDRDHAKWHYVVAGAPSPDHARRAFERTKRHRGQVPMAWTPGTLTMPTGPLSRYEMEEQ